MVITIVVSIVRHARTSPTRPQMGKVCSAHRLRFFFAAKSSDAKLS